MMPNQQFASTIARGGLSNCSVHFAQSTQILTEDAREVFISVITSSTADSMFCLFQ